METLTHVWEQARKGHGQVMAFVGEPGVGKSRLYWEFLHSSQLADTLVLEASSVSYGKATPYLPLIDLLKKYFEIQLQQDERGIKEKINGKARDPGRIAAGLAGLDLRAARSQRGGSGVARPRAPCSDANGRSTRSPGSCSRKRRGSASASFSRICTGLTMRPKRCSTTSWMRSPWLPSFCWSTTARTIRATGRRRRTSPNCLWGRSRNRARRSCSTRCWAGTKRLRR